MEQIETLLLKSDRLKKIVDETYSNAMLYQISSGASYVSVLLIYLASGACLFFAFIMHRVFPFHILGQIVYKRELIQYFSVQELKTFEYAVRALVVVIAILLFYIGMQMRSYRKRKKQIQQTAKSLKEIYNEEIDAGNQKKTMQDAVITVVEPKEFTI
jgi:cbb3-type cytochrome oxidase subunit 3